jgi:hypothetical protein
VGSYHRHLISEMQAGGVTTHRCRQKVLIKDDLVQAGIDGSSASAVWSLRASRDITRGKVIEGVIGEKLFGLRSGDKGSITRNKGEGELVVSEEPMGAQGRRQLYSIIGLEGMPLCQMRRCCQGICAQRHNRITMGELTHEAAIGAIPLYPRDPTDTLDDGQPSSDLNSWDLSDKDDMTSLSTYWFLLIDHLPYPGTSRFADVIFHQSTRIEVV